MRVLIVDDDLVSLRLLRGYLEKWGYEAVEAPNGAVAWSLFQGEDFRLVIVDWMMPEMDGLELVRRIRSCEQQGYVYCILLTARSEKEDLVEGMEAGADDFLSKPFDRDELRVRLREGERIVRLERGTLQQSRALREAREALAESEPLARLGQQSAEIASKIETSLAAALEELTALRSQLEEPADDLVVRVLKYLNQARGCAEQIRQQRASQPSPRSAEAVT
jgi:DNA-binding response OmpR family regulator